jgi:hypothetical protein
MVAVAHAGKLRAQMRHERRLRLVDTDPHARVELHDDEIRSRMATQTCAAILIPP